MLHKSHQILSITFYKILKILSKLNNYVKINYLPNALNKPIHFYIKILIILSTPIYLNHMYKIKLNIFITYKMIIELL